ncbi:MAG TPA: phospholipase D family protein [Casimicrobiaceae bacterium]|nr:phospholipase D family protein [Casimicrobiaceae bacterium]
MIESGGAAFCRGFAATLAAIALFAGGCATLPPGMDGPKKVTTALELPESTALGARFGAQAKLHPDLSGFRLLVGGTDSFLLHEQIAARVERTLDVQYFLLQQDDTGKLVLQALLEAADRGVRVRLLLDDAEAFDGGSTIRPLAAHPNIEIRIFNPFVVRRELSMFRWAEFVVGARRLNYRMHNKLFIGDNAIAVTGGRNVGDAYFQASAQIEFGDFDLAVVGPMVQALSRSFDKYWNDKLAIPVETLPLGKPTQAELDACRKALAAHKEKMATSSYVLSLPKRDLLAEALVGKPSVVWARAQLAYDTPDKAQVERDDQPGHLMWHRVAEAVEGTQRDLILVSPYLVPGEGEIALLRRLRERGIRVRILTNSLASTDMPIVHVGYMRSRVSLLEAGCELYEVRPVPGKPEAARGAIKSGSSSQFGLHAKVFVIDGRRAFVGSMNFDQRSLDINTEIGLIVDSPQIAREIAARFEAIVQPANSYRVVLQANPGGGDTIQWITEVDGKGVTFDAEPDVDPGKRALIQMLSVLPLDTML